MGSDLPKQTMEEHFDREIAYILRKIDRGIDNGEKTDIMQKEKTS